MQETFRLSALSYEYVNAKLRLFTDSSKAILKCVLSIDCNKHASISIGRSVMLKESYNTMNLFLKIRYNE